jgi:hypothetical protein
MIYFASQAGNSLHYADECDYSLRVDMKVGNVKHTEVKMVHSPFPPTSFRSLSPLPTSPSLFAAERGRGEEEGEV